MIDRNLDLPIYKQIKNILIEELHNMTSNSKVNSITEEELIRRFNVSRAPVRQALKELADEGYVYRARAKGTFPTQTLPVHPPTLEIGGLISYLKRNGMNCTSNVIEVKKTKPRVQLQKILNIQPQILLTKVGRVIFLKNKPIAWSQTFLLLPSDYKKPKSEVQQYDSFFELIKKDLNISITKGEHQIYASSAGPETASILLLEEGSPVLVIETKLYDQHNNLIGWRKAINIPEDYKISYTVN